MPARLVLKHSTGILFTATWTTTGVAASSLTKNRQIGYHDPHYIDARSRGFCLPDHFL